MCVSQNNCSDVRLSEQLFIQPLLCIALNYIYIDDKSYTIGCILFLCHSWYSCIDRVSDITGGGRGVTKILFLCIMRINANFMTGRTILRFKSFDFDNLRV